MKSLFWDVVFYRWYARLLILACSLLATVLALVGPLLQKDFIDLLTGQTNNLDYFNFSHPLFYILFAFVAVLLSQVFSQLTNYLGAREAIYMQGVFSEKLYNKTLNLRLDTMSQKPIGEIVAIYATDVPGATVFLDQTLPAGASTFFPLVLAPFAISYIFEIPIGPTLQVMFFIIALNSLMAFRQSRFFFKFKQLAAERVALVNEWIQNIRTIRILGWINHFEKNIFIKREIETANRVKMVTNGQIMNAISSSITFVLNIITLYTLVYSTKHQVTSGELLALLWIVGIFLTRPFRQMPWFFTFAFDSWTSLKRLEGFLKIKNSNSDFSSQQRSLTNETKSIALDVESLNLKIGDRQILSDINFKVSQGELVAIVGEVGCGKSMLLLSLLGETGAQFKKYYINDINAKTSTIDHVRTQFAYVPQEGFIMSASLRENVAFVYDIPTAHDSEIGESLRLAQFDISNERVEKGLDTEIGERGVNLSGGQKQRVSLARVHFYNAPILLLDDSLSALDVDTEHKIFDELIIGAWKERTRLLVTHRLSALSRVDRILFMEEGKIIAQGTYTELLAKNSKFRDFTMSVAKEANRGEH